MQKVSTPTSPDTALEAFPERANLYKITLDPMPTRLYHVRTVNKGVAKERVSLVAEKEAVIRAATVPDTRRAIQAVVMASLRQAGYKVRERFPLIVDTTKNYAPGNKSLEIFTAFDQAIMSFDNNYYLCLNHHLVVRSRLSLQRLTQLDSSLQLQGAQRVFFKEDDEWNEGRFVSVDNNQVSVALASGDTAVVPYARLIPDLNRQQVDQLAPGFGVSAQQLERTIKQYAYLTTANAPRARLDSCSEFVARLTQGVFPIILTGITVRVDHRPAVLRPPDFVLGQDLEEVPVAFDHVDKSKRATNILSGLTSFGAYDKPASELRLAVVSTEVRADGMEKLVERLNKGYAQYPGAAKTFGGGITIAEHIRCKSISDYEGRLQQFVRQSNFTDFDAALVYLPATGKTTDPQHAYFRTKGLLAREGLASQMVDEPTVLNPNWRDLNLALNIFAKAGYAPWVLDEAMPGVDLFIGLSSSQVQQSDRTLRVMGYANVFDAYGRWRFYQGDTQAFAFEDRMQHFGAVVQGSIAAYRAENGGPLKVVHIHLTKRFSAEERAVLATAVRQEVPGATVVFVWVNPDHNVRLYDLTPGSDGQIGRATYLLDDPGRLYLTTTGNNMFQQKMMGTAIPLQLTVWTDPSQDPLPRYDVAQQILSLTRLNWASTRNFCQEPITTKFAGDIAWLMTAFLQQPGFSVNTRLRDKPWFL